MSLSPTWKIRDVTRADAQRLSLIGSATFLETFAGVLDGDAIVEHCRDKNSATTYERYLDTGACGWLAEAQPGGAPIGFAILCSPDLPGIDPSGGDLELKRIYALSRFHGAGMGAELMRCVVRRAIEQKAKRLLLGVYSLNRRAIAFYAKNGFEQIGERLFRVGHRDYQDVVLAKRLG